MVCMADIERFVIFERVPDISYSMFLYLERTAYSSMTSDRPKESSPDNNAKEANTQLLSILALVFSPPFTPLTATFLG